MKRKILIPFLSFVFCAFPFMNAVCQPANLCPFIKGQTYAWVTNANSNGSFKVVSVDGDSFKLEQSNVKDKAAGIAKFRGTFKDGQLVMQNLTYSEIWKGTLKDGKITGKVNRFFTFEIKGVFADMSVKPTREDSKVPSFLPEGKSAVSTAPFLLGEILSWSTSINQRGTMKVVSVDGAKFVVEQINERNKSAGAVKLEGEVNGKKCTLINRRWRENWVGKISGDTVKGSVNNRSTFVIVGRVSADKLPEFKKGPVMLGKMLKWKTSAGQNGTLKLVSITGKSFVFEQVNFKNKAAGAVKLEGEIKDDGSFSISNKKWNENWVGKISGNKVVGKVNKIYTFEITE